MVGDGVEVEGTLDLHVEARGVVKGLAEREAIRVVGCGNRAHQVRVQGIGGVYVQIPEERHTVGIRSGRAARERRRLKPG